MSEEKSKKGDYFIDAENTTEMARLIKQDRAITEAMGGPLAGIHNPDALRTILDLGCGPGQWVLNVAFEQSTAEVAGIDISEIMIKYANARARSQNLPNAKFEVMDITKPLEFSDHTFDLVNGRLIAFLSPLQWKHLTHECMRITRPGGVIRFTESEYITNSPAADKLCSLFYMALHRAGQSFSPTGRTVSCITQLRPLLQEAGCTDIQQKAFVVDFSAGMPHHEAMTEANYLIYLLMKPFLLGTQVTTEGEFDQLIQKVRQEVKRDTFTAMLYFLSVWGTVPGKE